MVGWWVGWMLVFGVKFEIKMYLEYSCDFCTRNNCCHDTVDVG